MCYGNLDPKLMMREMDARLKSANSMPVKEEKPKVTPKARVFAPIRLALLWWKRKELPDL
jgi:hypothetical protein